VFRKIGVVLFILLIGGAWCVWWADESCFRRTLFEEYLANATGRSDIAHDIPAYLLPTPEVVARFQPNHVFEGQLPSAHMRFAGLDYLIPKNFVSASNYYSSPERDRNGVLLRTEYPQFRGMTPENYISLMRMSPSTGQALQILIAVPSLDDKANLDLLRSRFTEALPFQYLDSYRFNLVNGPYGLWEVRLSDEASPHERADKAVPSSALQQKERDVFFIGESFSEGVLVCVAEGARPLPHCTHSFTESGTVVSITYKRTLLRQWKRIAHCTVRLLERFRGESPNDQLVCSDVLEVAR